MSKPNTKVAAGGLAGSLSVLIVWGLSSLGIEVPPEASAALATVVAFGVSYLVPEKSES